jgi:hypothetical protein
MKKFLKDLTLARAIILGSLVLSVALAVTGFKLHQQRKGLEVALRREVPELARQTQVLSRRYSRLYDEAEREGLKGQGDPETYFRHLATDSKVLLGGIDISKPTPTRPTKGVIDIKYRIVPQVKDRGSDRKNLANYMWLIEEQSRRVRVTQLRLDREGNLKPWEYGNDRWKWDIEVTSRQKEEGQKDAAAQ